MAKNRWAIFVAGGLIVLGGLAAYHNSLSGPFTFDDAGSILENSTIRHLWPLGSVLTPPSSGGQTVGGRPVLNLSLAINYSISGTEVWSYHALNALIHILAGLALFGIVRRTLAGWGGRSAHGFFGGDEESAGKSALFLGFASALLWTVHPLQTEAVTYTIQRAESLMGLFYLLTLYCFIRGAETGDGQIENRKAECGNVKSGSSTEKLPISAFRFPISSSSVSGFPLSAFRFPIWLSLSCIACLLGMATKEVMVSAPAMVFLYDRTFVTGSFRGAWTARRGYYAALGSTLLLLAGLMGSTHNRGGSIGYGNGVPWWAYSLTQFLAVAHYLRLSFWPHPLVFDYGIIWIRSAGEVLPAAAVVLAAVGLTFWALFRPANRGFTWRPLGFLGFWFFGILAPTSSIVPGTTQMIVEHRLYLSLAAPLVLAVVGIHALVSRAAKNTAAAVTAFAVCVPLAAVCCALTVRRNEIYRDGLTLWRDTVAKRPYAARPRSYLAAVLLTKGYTAESSAEYEEASRLDPDYPMAHNGRGTIYLKAGRVDDAIGQYEQAVREAPGYAEAQYNLGLALLTAGRAAEAIPHEEIAIHQRPDYPDALNTLGNALFRLGRPDAAIPSYEAAVRLRPDDVEVRNNLGIALANVGRLRDAVAQLEEAVRLKPGDAALRSNLERVRAALGSGAP